MAMEHIPGACQWPGLAGKESFLVLQLGHLPFAGTDGQY